METRDPGAAGTAARPSLRTYLTDDQLAYFRQKILAERAVALEEIERLRRQIGEDSERAEDDPDRLHHVIEVNHNVASSMIDHAQQLLEALDRALLRIEDKTYGLCVKTGKPIPLERLEAVPHTAFSVEAEVEAEAGRST